MEGASGEARPPPAAPPNGEDLFVRCFLCSRPVKRSFFNTHLDVECDKMERKGKAKATTRPAVGALSRAPTPPAPGKRKAGEVVVVAGEEEGGKRAKRDKSGALEMRRLLSGIPPPSPPCFRLRWDGTVPFATFGTEQKGESDPCVATIKWNTAPLRFRCGTAARDADPGDNDGSHAAYKQHHIPLLKSHLQKCIRRRRADLAVRTAKHMLCVDPSALLRRLPVAMIEDGVLLVHGLPLVVWMMGAVSKGFALTRAMQEWVLGVVHAVAVCEWKDMQVDARGLERLDLAVVSKDVQTAVHRDSVLALQLRMSFGGMAGDMRMLSRMSRVWFGRFVAWERDPSTQAADKAWEVAHTKVTPVEWSSVPPLRRSDWELSAVDFHCTNIRDLLASEPGAPEGDGLRRLMWRCSSSVTSKQALPGSGVMEPSAEDEVAAWERLRPAFEQLATRLLRSKGVQ